MRKMLALTFAIVMTLSALVSTALGRTQASEQVPTSVFVDRSEYRPGEAVTITGSGWQPFEVVTVTLKKSTEVGSAGEVTLFIHADADGKISSSEFVTADADLGLHFLLIAEGAASSKSAATSFTD